MRAWFQSEAAQRRLHLAGDALACVLASVFFYALLVAFT
jgi:hypothetical protein